MRPKGICSPRGSLAHPDTCAPRGTLALLLLLAGCMHMGPHTNEAVLAQGRKVSWRGPIGSATFCASCGAGAPTVVTFGSPGQLVLTIPSCYPHAHSKIGDHDAISIVRSEDHAAAAAGQLEIDDCTSSHLMATLTATWPDGEKVDAIIDTPLTRP